jgi:hypothetical protein
MRIDVPHLRLIESGVVYDFDTLAGGILAGKLPYVVTGFVPAAWVNGAAASSLSLVTADSIFVNYQASENGSMLMVPSDRAPEQLTVTNSRVSGNFTVSQTNYVSLDLTRTEDPTTSDVVHFIDPATSQGTPKIIPLGRTMDYRIHISTAPFSTNPQRCPVMIVETDASNNILSVADARPMMFRLAAGGDTPDALAKYAWPEGRNIGIDPADESANFTGGDKAIGDMKSWISAITEMIWQINAGEYWYSNTQMTSTWFMPSGTNVWSWNLGTETISWTDPLEIVFTGSTAMHNTVAAGSAVLMPDTALYVDFNRYVDGTVLVPSVGPISTLNGEPATPGIRYPIAWRVGSGTPAVRNLPVPAGSSPVGIATTTTPGSVYLNTAAATPYAVVSNALGGSAIAAGLLRPSAGALNIGTTANETSISIGGGVNNQAISIGFASATLGATAIYGKTVTIGIASGTGQMNTSIAQVGCTTGAVVSLGVNSDATVNINTGAVTSATTAIGTAAVGTVQVRAAAVNINDAGVSSTTIGSSAGGTVNVLGPIVNINNVGTSTSTVIGNVGGTSNLTLLGVSIDLGNASTTSTDILGADVNINTSGSGITTIGSASAGAIYARSGTSIFLGGAFLDVTSTSTGVANYNRIKSQAGVCPLVVDTVGVSGADLFGAWNNGVLQFAIKSDGKAVAGTATASGDSALTLTSKGYVDGTSATWTAVTPGSGWQSSSVYYTKHNGVVHLRGEITSTAGTTNACFTLPAGYRPATILHVVADIRTTAVGNYHGYITIGTDGTAVPYYAATYPSVPVTPIAGQVVYFDNISFPVW